MQLHKPTADAQPEAGAAGAPTDGQVQLLERLEDLADALARNAGPCVLYEGHDLIALPLGTYTDTASLRKSASVAQEVEHDLPDAYGIAGQDEVVRYVGLQVQAL